MDEEKIAKSLRNDMLILGILETIIVIYLITLGNIPIANIVLLGALTAGYVGAMKKKKFASYIGIAIGSLMIITILVFDIIDCLLGIFVLKDSIKYLKNIK